MKYRFVRDDGEHHKGDVVDGMRLKDVRRLIREAIVEGADEKEQDTPPHPPVNQATAEGTPGANAP